MMTPTPPHQPWLWLFISYVLLSLGWICDPLDPTECAGSDVVLGLVQDLKSSFFPYFVSGESQLLCKKFDYFKNWDLTKELMTCVQLTSEFL